MNGDLDISMDKSKSLAGLYEKVEKADLPLKWTATKLVFGKGNPHAAIMFVAEAPGKNEDLQGLPFVGAAGKILDTMLKSIGLTIDDIYIANILKYRPPNNREPQKDEIIAHTPYLIEQIKIIQPKIIVTLGNYATKFILSSCDVEAMDKVPGISTLHGKEKKVVIAGVSYRIVPMYHPAALMYDRKLMTVAEQDFKNLKAELGQRTLSGF